MKNKKNRFKSYLLNILPFFTASNAYKPNNEPIKAKAITDAPEKMKFKRDCCKGSEYCSLIEGTEFPLTIKVKIEGFGIDELSHVNSTDELVD